MAPIQPPHRTSRPAKSILKTSAAVSKTESSRSEPLFAASKKDKRRIKHAQLMAKVSKSSSKPRRGRPNKKLATTLDSLADALPDEKDETSSGIPAGAKPNQQINIIKRKSLKSKPGALRRRQNLDNAEWERFARNMAQMAAVKSEAPNDSSNERINTPRPAPADPTSRWTALRGFIATTLERKPDLRGDNP